MRTVKGACLPNRQDALTAFFRHHALTACSSRLSPRPFSVSTPCAGLSGLLDRRLLVQSFSSRVINLVYFLSPIHCADESSASLSQVTGRPGRHSRVGECEHKIEKRSNCRDSAKSNPVQTGSSKSSPLLSVDEACHLVGRRMRRNR